MKPQFFLIFLIPLLLLSVTLFGAAPIVTDVSPPIGLSSGGTSITITGSGFTGTTAINFGTTPASSFILNSDTSITAISPAHSPQVLSVTITTTDGTSLNTGDSFYTYQGSLQAYVANSNANTV